MTPGDSRTSGVSEDDSRLGGVARGFVILAYGLFSIAAQTLIFREFITSFESNDIAVGIFFGCWFLWIALGAIVVSKSGRLADWLTSNVELILLLYLPAFVIQAGLIIQIRQLAGIAPYALLPIPAALILGVLVNALVSFLTGLLFPVICRWVRRDTTSAVSRVYLLESLGSFLGGLGTTVLLAYGVSSAQVFLVLAFILTLAIVLSLFFVSQFNRIIFKIISFLIVIFFGFTIVTGGGTTFTKFINTVKWSRLLPEESLAGSFQTAQAEYLYGRYQNQWVVVRQGSVIEAVPDPTTAGRIIALTLSQNPKARRVLIIGSGLGLCRQFLELPQINRLVWAEPDGEYIKNVLQVLPRDLGIADKRFENWTGDVRSMLANGQQRFDLVIVNMPDVLSSASNRYWTLDFYGQVKRSLNPDGVLAICVASGENIMGTELVTIGASAKQTLSRVFANMVFVPGDLAWFIASDGNGLTGDPGVLRDRFAGIANTESVYPANGLLSIYLPDRAAKAIDAYNSADLPVEHLINLDSRPLANLFSLLLSARQSDAPVTRLFKYLLPAGFPVFLAPIVIFVLLRFVFILSSSNGGKPSIFDSTFLIFSTGAVGIGVVIILMFLYQMRFGSLYLYIGAISSLYMAGLAGGSALANGILSIRSRKVIFVEILLGAFFVAHCWVLTIVAFWPAEEWQHLHFAIAFVICGLCAGCYFPIAARMLADRQIETTSAASDIEKADHFGAMAGGLLTSLVLIPVLGTQQTLFVFILLILTNYPAMALRIHYPGKIFGVMPRRAFGWSLFGIAASLVVCSNLIASAKLRLSPTLPVQAAQALAGTMRIEPASATIPDTGKTATYFKTYDNDGKLTGFIFSSDDFAGKVSGFAGKINIAVFADVNGGLIDFHIIRSNETPSYLDMLSGWFGLLKGRDIFRPDPFDGIDAVTGATVSSKAIIQSVAQSGAAFASGVLGQTGQQKPGAITSRLPNPEGIYLIGSLLLTGLVIYFGGFRSRLLVLGFNLIVGGIIFNAQYSTEQIATLLSLTLPFASLAGVFLLTVGVPILVVLFGNIYCGYMCPFGALQELVGLLILVRLRPVLSREQMQKARFIKYVILFVLIALYFLSRNHNAIALDPLIKVFSFSHLDTVLLVIIGIALVGSVFYSRFWCRYFCPAGAFLSLFNKIALFSRFLPAKRYANCEYGLSFNDKLDCIYCDKCRFEKKPAVAEKSASFGSRYFIPAILVIAAGVAVISFKNVVNQLSVSSVVAASTPSEEQHRNVDMQQIRKKIEENKLSDHEANFYKKLE
jgi:predicted membrane-bound spermidine synthase/Na+-translocating ferredoxin:NAD+ oxidoreductase RnfG subunit